MHSSSNKKLDYPRKLRITTDCCKLLQTFANFCMWTKIVYDMCGEVHNWMQQFASIYNMRKSDASLQLATQGWHGENGCKTPNLDVHFTTSPGSSQTDVHTNTKFVLHLYCGLKYCRIAKRPESVGELCQKRCRWFLYFSWCPKISSSNRACYTHIESQWVCHFVLIEQLWAV